MQKGHLQPHFMAVKTFLPLIADKEGSSYTFITGQWTAPHFSLTCSTCLIAGGLSNYVVPNAGFITLFVGAVAKLALVVRSEYSTKPVRVNEVQVLYCVNCVNCVNWGLCMFVCACMCANCVNHYILTTRVNLNSLMQSTMD